ncbi:MAG: glycosyltransferase family 39 protein [Elusimicrobia bacterium]|nr:glycosyltransferase family 39 protein [Elusimicrobiota bacterium]
MIAPSFRRQALRDCAALASAALGLRLAALLILPRILGSEYPGYYDDGAYVAMARVWAGFPGEHVVIHPPGYPLFLAPFCLLGSAGLSLALLAQAALSSATVALAYLMAAVLGASRPAACLGGVLCAINPMFVFFSTRFMVETLFVFLVLAFFLLWLKAWNDGDARLAAAAGVAGGLSALTRGVILPFGGVLALAALWAGNRDKRRLSLVGACGIAWALTMTPWTVRNALHHGRFIPVSMQGGWNLYEGLTIDLDEIRRSRPAAMGAEAAALGLKDPFAVDAHFGRKAAGWIRENPGRFAGLALRKALRFWRPWPYPPHPASARALTGIFYVALFSLAIAGLCMGAASHPAWIFPLAWCAHLTVMHAVFAGNLRYRLPLEPMVAVFAGVGLSRLLSKTGIDMLIK